MPDSLRPHGLQHAKLPHNFTISRSLLKLMPIESMMPLNNLLLCHPLLLPSIFPSIRVFFNESVFHMRLPKYWSFSFSISPSNEYSGLISFRIEWFDILAVQGTLKSLLQHHSSKVSFFLALSLLNGLTLTSIHDYWKNHNLGYTDISGKIMSEFQENFYICFTDLAKTFDCVDHNKLKNSSRDGNTRPPYLSPVKSVCRTESNS